MADALRRFAAPGVIWFHVPNEGFRSPIMGRLMKRMGLVPGVADFVIVQPAKPHAQVWFLELKTEHGHQSESQKRFERRCKDAGVEYVLARGLEQALEALSSRGAIRISL